MALNQRPMDDSKVISPWGMAVRNLSPEAGQAVGRVQHRTRSHRSSQGYARGGRHPNAKLTDDAVKAIRKTVKVREALLKKIRAEMGNEALAKKHGVNVSTINKYIGNRLRIQRDGEDVV